MRKAAGALIFALLLGATQARSENLEVSPVSVEMTPSQRAITLSLVNHAAAAALIQVRPFAWKQDDGIDHLVPTEELAVSPRFVQLAPEQALTIRVLPGRAPGRGETAYRLLVDELSPPSASGPARVMRRLSLPVFITAEQPRPALLDWQVALLSTGPALIVRNSGETHVSLTGVEMLLGTRHISVSTGGHPDVLAGSVMEWPIIDHGWIRLETKARLQAASNVGPIEVAVPITAGP